SIRLCLLQLISQRLNCQVGVPSRGKKQIETSDEHFCFEREVPDFVCNVTSQSDGHDHNNPASFKFHAIRLLRRGVNRRGALARAMGIRSDTLRQSPSTRSFADSLGQNLYWYPLARTLRLEIYSFLRRMKVVLQTEIYRRGVDFDPVGSTVSDWPEQQQAQD